jgi:periplasmic protein TonB
MKFIRLQSRGGNYLVVAENVAWLRTAENGQTSVGIVGGQPLLVVGTIEEVAAQILAGAAPDEPEAEAPPAPPVAAAAEPFAEPPELEPIEKIRAEAIEAPNPTPAAPLVVEHVADTAPEPQPAPPIAVPSAGESAPAPSQRPARAEVMPLAQRIARANRSQVKGGSQRFMSALD